MLAGLLALVELVVAGEAKAINAYPRCVSREGNKVAQALLWKVFRPTGGRWRGIAHVPSGNLRLRDEYAHVDARRRFDIDVESLWRMAPPALVEHCVCGDIMAGIASPDGLHVVRARVHAGDTGGCVHGVERRHVPDLVYGATHPKLVQIGRAP